MLELLRMNWLIDRLTDIRFLTTWAASLIGCHVVLGLTLFWITLPLTFVITLILDKGVQYYVKTINNTHDY